MKSISLIGMPGVGKSTIGVILAKVLGMKFIDTDILIQQKDSRLLQEIIDTDGIGKFLEIEEKSLLSLKLKENTVIATGGSVIYSKKAMGYLKKNSIVIFLKLDYNGLVERINNITTRGIVMDKKQKLLDIYAERIFLYEAAADIIIDCSEKNVEDIVGEINDTMSDNLIL